MADDISAMNVPALKAALKEAGVTGYSKLNKAELINALKKARGIEPDSGPASATKRKRTKETEGEESPTKKAKVSAKAKSKAKEKEEDEDEEEEEEEEEKEDEDEDNADKTATSKESGTPGSYWNQLVDPGWKELLKDEMSKSYFKAIEKFVAEERKTLTIFPADNEVLNCFNFTPLDKVRVVIIGQDPYFNKGEAHGLCFSVRKDIKVPPSLKRIYKVLEKTVDGFTSPKHGYLEEWARRGVLLLNATLTVQEKKANSHAKCGWLTFTNTVIDKLNKDKSGLIFFLWGGFAQKVGKNLDTTKHHVLSGPHPSPMSGEAWNSCTHFADANKLLKQMGKDEIDWTISD